MPRKNIPEKRTTSITISREIRDKLNTLKIIPEEHLNSVLKRLINEYEGDKKE